MREIVLERPLDLRASFAPLVSSFGDPTTRLRRDALVRATRTPAGPATLALERVGDRLQAYAWGPGSEWALARAGDWAGVDDEPDPLPSAAGPVAEFARRAPGLRLPRTGRVFETLVLLVLQQKVTGKESSRAFGNLVRHLAEPAPGPFEGLLLPVARDALLDLSPAWAPRLGIPAGQMDTLLRVAFQAGALERVADLSAAEAERRLCSVPGIGPWTAGSLLLLALGHADAVPVGDFHLPSIVAWNLAGERRADDARMLELLEPFRGQRGRVLRWIEISGTRPARRAPRRALRAHH